MQAELRLEKMIHGGLALGRLADGQIALVAGAIPGETIIAALQDKKGVLQGHVLELLQTDPARIPAALHPGLDYSFMTYEKQLELKREVVMDALARSLKRELSVPAVRAAPHIWRYRNTVQPVVSKVGLGYRKPESHEILVLKEDPVAQNAINGIWQQWSQLKIPKGVRELVFRSNQTGEVLVSLIASASARNYLDFAHLLLDKGVKGVTYAQFDARGRFRSGSERLAGERSIQESYGRFTISMSATNFAQPNPTAATELYQALERLAPGGRLALDLYAGSGIIGMHLADKYDKVIALDIDRGSITRGQQDAERMGLQNLSFMRSDAKTLELPEALDLITVDPPRAGLNKELRQRLTVSSAKHLIYVSCDVATWARDVADFEGQGWTLSHFEPFDFYPHTHHIELLSVLER